MTNEMHHLTTCIQCDAPLDEDEGEECYNCRMEGEWENKERYRQMVAFQLRG